MIEPFKLETINVTEKLSGQDPSVPINVTSFSSFTEENSEIWSQKQIQSGNIHSIILDVHVGRQSAQTFFSFFLQRKLDNTLTLSPLFSFIKVTLIT